MRYSIIELRDFYRKHPGLQAGPLIFKGEPTDLGETVIKESQKCFLPGCLWFDAGCGAGELSRYLAGRFRMKFIAGDLSPANPDSVKLDLMELPFGDAVFNGALLSDVIEHIPDWARLFHELRRVLKPGGKLLIFSPNYDNLCGKVKKALEAKGGFEKNQFAPFQKWRRQYFERHITVGAVRERLADLDFVIEKDSTYWNLDGFLPFIYLLPDYFLYGPVLSTLRIASDRLPWQRGLYFNLIARKSSHEDSCRQSRRPQRERNS